MSSPEQILPLCLTVREFYLASSMSAPQYSMASQAQPFESGHWFINPCIPWLEKSNRYLQPLSNAGAIQSCVPWPCPLGCPLFYFYKSILIILRSSLCYILRQATLCYSPILARSLAGCEPVWCTWGCWITKQLHCARIEWYPPYLTLCWYHHRSERVVLLCLQSWECCRWHSCWIIDTVWWRLFAWVI